MFENKFLHRMDKAYRWTITTGSNLQSLMLLYMRVIWGHQLFLIGLSKFFQTDIVAQFFSTLNIPAPSFAAYVVAFFELTGGFCLFFGFASRLMALPVIFIMVSALSMAHREVFTGMHFLFEPLLLVQQAPYPFILTALLVFIFGPGRVSVDAWIKRWVSRQPTL